MSIKTTYTCDLCGHRQDENTGMFALEINVKRCGPYGTFSTARRALWCRPCTEKYRLCPSKPDAAILPAEPTIEELIREIVREEVKERS